MGDSAAGASQPCGEGGEQAGGTPTPSALLALLAGARAAGGGVKRRSPGAASGRPGGGGKASRSSAAAATTAATPSRTPPESSFAACPLCSRNVPRALLESHAAGCEGVPASAAPSVAALPKPTQPAAAARPTKPPPQGAAVKQAKAAPSRAPPPAKQKASQPPAPPRPRPAAPARGWAPAPPLAPAPAHDRAAPPQPQPSHLPPAAPSAFEALRAGAEAAHRGAGVFALASSPGGFTLSWGWGLPAAPPPPAARRPAWRGEVTVRPDGCGGARVALQFAADAPAAPAPLGWPPPPSPPRSPAQLSPSLLKSALQKCVRRGLPGAAARLAAHGLLSASRDLQLHLLRRLPVVAVEDALPLMPGFGLCVWLGCAVGAGFNLSQHHADALVRWVADLAACGVREAPEGGGGGGGGGGGADAQPRMLPAPPAGARDAGGPPPPPREAPLVCRLLRLRARYGGAAGDVAMLEGAAAAWHARLRPGAPHAPRWRTLLHHRPSLAPESGGGGEGGGGSSPAAAAAAGCAWASSEPLRRADVPPAAVDQHCSPAVDALLRDHSVAAAAAAYCAAAAGEGGCGGGGGGGSSPEAAVGAALWAFSGAVSAKAPLRLGGDGAPQPPPCGGGGGDDAAAAAPAAAADAGGDGSAALRRLWGAVEGPHADFARAHLDRCFAGVP